MNRLMNTLASDMQAYFPNATWQQFGNNLDDVFDLVIA